MLIEASRKKRLINFIVDLIAIGLLMELTFIVEGMVENKAPLQISRMIIIWGGYYIPLEYFFGKTLGKVFTKTRVVNSKGGKIDFRQSAIRFLCRGLPFEFLSLALGADAKAWHDTISKTHVIDEKKQAEMAEKIDSIG